MLWIEDPAESESNWESRAGQPHWAPDCGRLSRGWPVEPEAPQALHSTRAVPGRTDSNERGARMHTGSFLED